MSANMKQTDRVKELRQPVEQIWLAGLGALALTEEEGGKLFKSLVKRGKGFEKITRNRLEDAFEATRAVPGNAMARIEEGVSDTFSGVLRRLGVPSRREINSLTRRVEGLATTLEKRTAKPRRAAPKAKRNGMKRRAASATPA
jgi:poly(hydroxyalkanoate) granule-associated protein